MPIDDPLHRLSANSWRNTLEEQKDPLRLAEHLHDAGEFSEVERLTRLIRNQTSDVALLAQADGLACRVEFSLGRGRTARPALERLDAEYGQSVDPRVRAHLGFAWGSYFSCGGTGEKEGYAQLLSHLGTASEIFEALGEIDFAIQSRIMIAAAHATGSKYLRTIREIEVAMELASKHGAFRYTGRLLAAGCCAAADQGYRKGLEEALLRAIEWCDFVGDNWGKAQSRLFLGRLIGYSIPSGDPDAAARPESFLLEAQREAEAINASGLAGHAAASLAWLYKKAGDASSHQRVLDEESEREGGRRRHFEGLSRNTVEVVEQANVRMASHLWNGIENHPDAFFVFGVRSDSEQGVDFLNEFRNDAGARLLGLRAGAVFLYSEAQESPYLSGLGDHLIAALDQRLTYQDHHRFDTGEESFWYLRRIVPSADGVILIIRDVTAEHRIETALRNAAESAERSDRAKSEFLANMSHEIRTPINGVLGLARLLADTDLSPTQRAYVEDIVGSGDILIGVIGNILDLSKVESHSMTLDVRPSRVDEIVQGTVRLFAGQAKEKGIDLAAMIDPSVPRAILADGVRIKQVVANLVGNAVKFTQRGSVGVLVRKDGDQLSIEVTDTGIGIPADRLEAIFDRFRQASPQSHLFGGTGLGLTLSRGIVELMGGTISVSSQLGEGSRFEVRIPVTEAFEDEVLMIESEPVRLDGVRVLVVDDNRVNRMVSQYSLEKLGCVVTAAANGVEALELWEAEIFDAVLMDIRMPVMDGLEATREIRRREGEMGVRIPIVALTAGAMVEERSECFDAGMDDYISKPFTDDVLREVLAKLVAGKGKRGAAGTEYDAMS